MRWPCPKCRAAVTLPRPRMRFDESPVFPATCGRCQNEFVVRLRMWRLALAFLPLAVALSVVVALPESRVVVGDVDVVHGVLACVLVFAWAKPAWRFCLRATST